VFLAGGVGMPGGPLEDVLEGQEMVVGQFEIAATARSRLSYPAMRVTRPSATKNA
jgi:hypothetical protein